MPKQLTVAEARNQLARVMHETERSGPVEVTRRGQPVAVIVSIREYCRLTAKKGGFWSAYQKWRTIRSTRMLTSMRICSKFEGVMNISRVQMSRSQSMMLGRLEKPK